jgi:hypothetical protein
MAQASVWTMFAVSFPCMGTGHGPKGLWDRALPPTLLSQCRKSFLNDLSFKYLAPVQLRYPSKDA